MTTRVASFSYMSNSLKSLHLDAPLVRQIGCVIGTHTGPGAFGIAFFDKELVLE